MYQNLQIYQSIYSINQFQNKFIHLKIVWFINQFKKMSIHWKLLCDETKFSGGMSFTLAPLSCAVVLSSSMNEFIQLSLLSLVQLSFSSVSLAQLSLFQLSVVQLNLV